MDQDATWYADRPRPRQLSVRWGPRSPLPKRGRSPHRKFSAHLHCAQTAAWIKMTLFIEVCHSPGDIVLDGDPAPLPKRGAKLPPQFSAHVCCGQTAGWIKMALGMEVGLGPAHIVVDGTQRPPQKGIFGPCLLWLNGWMDQDVTWYGSRPRSAYATMC